jgi:transposase
VSREDLRLKEYAPDLNPVEMVRSHLKYGLLTNFVPRHVEHLDEVVQGHLGRLSRAPSMIKSLWAGPRLPFPGTKLTT